MWWRLSDVWTGIAISAFGLMVLLILIPTGVVIPDALSPRAVLPSFWPDITGWSLVVMGVLVALEALWKSSVNEATPKPAARAGMEDAEAKLRLIKELGAALASFAVLFAAWALIDFLGLPITASLLLVVLALMFGERRPAALITVGILVPGALYYFFTVIASVPIPTGSLLEQWNF